LIGLLLFIVITAPQYKGECEEAGVMLKERTLKMFNS